MHAAKNGALNPIACLTSLTSHAAEASPFASAPSTHAHANTCSPYAQAPCMMYLILFPEHVPIPACHVLLVSCAADVASCPNTAVLIICIITVIRLQQQNCLQALRQPAVSCHCLQGSLLHLVLSDQQVHLHCPESSPAVLLCCISDTQVPRRYLHSLSSVQCQKDNTGRWQACAH